MRNDIDRPNHCEVANLYGSDALAEMMRRLDIPYVALNPGSSFRGLHDSLVNYLGNRSPQMLLCLHEEHAVAIAQGWAKVTEKPLGVILHANVGVMHAAMAIYNAWCDRVPMLIFGATGPVDAAKRRPWIDWLHTSRDQAAVVRPYVKWDDQPASLEASLEAMVRAAVITATPPMAPTYVCFDVTVQEAGLEAMPELPVLERYARPTPPSVHIEDISHLVNLLRQAKSPVFLMGRVSRNHEDWMRRVALAEEFSARVVTDIKAGAAFPTRHPLHAGKPSFFLSEGAADAINAADLIICFDWVDPAGTLAQARQVQTETTIVNVTLEPILQNGWSLDHQAFAPAGISLLARPDDVIAALCDRAGVAVETARATDYTESEKPEAGTVMSEEAITLNELADLLAVEFDGQSVTYARLPLGWDGAKCDFRDPLDYLGYDGGAGIGSGPGMAVGAALALLGSGRLPVAVLGDGDFVMGATALWTATHHELPLLVVVVNNRSYFNDEIHQEQVARNRGRPVENKHVGQAIVDPEIDIAALARAQGAVGFGPVKEAKDVAQIMSDAVQHLKDGATVVVDIWVKSGYTADMSKGMTQE